MPDLLSAEMLAELRYRLDNHTWMYAVNWLRENNRILALLDAAEEAARLREQVMAYQADPQYDLQRIAGQELARKKLERLRAEVARLREALRAISILTQSSTAARMAADALRPPVKEVSPGQPPPA